jgi:hypothetical protein
MSTTYACHAAARRDLRVARAGGPEGNCSPQASPDRELAVNADHAELAGPASFALQLTPRPGLAEPATGHRRRWHIPAGRDGHEFCVLHPPDQRHVSALDENAIIAATRLLDAPAAKCAPDHP